MHNNLLRKTTLKEVAAHAGVSLATVDRVISKRAPVSKRTEEKVIASIRELTGGSMANHSDTQPKQLKYGLVLESGAPFINSIEKTMGALKPKYSQLNVELNTYSYPSSRFNTKKFLAMLEEAGENNDGLIVLARELPAISNAINKIIEKGIPVTCFTSDLNDTSRLGYVGINNFSAGRTAGNLMGNYLNQQSGEVILVVSAPFRSQYERELGFRRFLRERFPNLMIRESLNNHDSDEDSYESLMKLFKSGVKPLGVYCVTGGTRGISQAIKDIGWKEELTFITHELNESSRELLVNHEIDIVLEQDLRSELITAVNTLLYEHNVIHTKPTLTPTSPLIFTPENANTPIISTVPTLAELEF